ncbi:hypothetical protein [Kordia sp.]|uniref:hypothetical protein n=1 Tax=Kordia sp. TaxID=1965332 RepID=UPI003B5B550B
MKLQKLALSIILVTITLFLVASCESSDDSNNNTPEPILLENYFFKGSLDNEVMNIENRIYDDFELSTRNRLDFGPSQTDDDQDPGSGYCYSLYACGIFPSAGVSAEDRPDSAKIYFTWIPVGDCTLANELTALRNFLELPNFEYAIFPESVNIPNVVGLDFFPKEFPNGETYFSSRFGDNTDASFQITAVEEIETGVFIVEGTLSCKLYKQNDDSEFKVLENGEFKIKISTNLDE